MIIKSRGKGLCSDKALVLCLHNRKEGIDGSNQKYIIEMWCLWKYKI